MAKKIQSFSCLLLLFLLQILTSKADDMAVCWGQNRNEGTLAETCATGKYSIVTISLLYGFGNNRTPQLNLAGHCDPSTSSCSVIGSDIRYCQKQGIKVLLSVGGGDEDFRKASSNDVKNFSDYLWNNFLGGNTSSSSSSSSSQRPLGDATLDGIDFYLPENAPHLKDLARYLKSHSTETQKVYLTAAPLCLSPDSALMDALDIFDYIWPQFFNYPSCEYSQANANNFVNSWNRWSESVKGAKILLGLAASQEATLSGYVPANLLISKVFPVVKKSHNYGGVILWSRYYDKLSGYSTSIQISPLCIIQSPPKCRRHDSGFVQRFGYMSMDSFEVYKSGNIDEQCCEMICRNNCSCEAYAAVNQGNNTGCQIWGKGSRFIGASGAKGQPIYVVEHKVNKWWIGLAIGIAATIPISLICYLCFVSWRKYRAKVDRKMNQKRILHEIGGNAMLFMAYSKAKRCKKHGNTSNEFEIFNFESIVAATDNFSAANKLGEGGFGPVYKGTLNDGQEVAIKRLSISSGQGQKEFKNEAKLMAKLQHTNLVRMLGLCIERDERILVYEYMPNKSLDLYLFDANRRYLLDWKKRFNIIEGIAQGLLYLHKYSRLKVIHRDLKASNILVDEQMNPKISDFGLARIFGMRESEEKTNRVVGTYGYMSPEYAINGVVSIKADVFSFGVLLLEILSGKKNNSLDYFDRSLNLIGYAWQLWNEGRALELTDSALNEESTQNKVVRSIHIGLLCVQDHAYDRPSMEDVVSFLSNDTIQLAQPKQPAFFIGVDVKGSDLSNSSQNHYSINDVTISVTVGR